VFIKDLIQKPKKPTPLAKKILTIQNIFQTGSEKIFSKREKEQTHTRLLIGRGFETSHQEQFKAPSLPHNTKLTLAA